MAKNQTRRAPQPAPEANPAPLAQAPTVAALPQTSNPATRIAAAMRGAAVAALYGNVEAPLVALGEATGLAVASAMPRKCYGGARFDFAALPASGAWFVGVGNKAPPARGDGQGGASAVLANLQARAGVGGAGVVCLRAFVLALMGAQLDASIAGGATRAFTNSDKGKRGPNGGTLAPFTLYAAPPR